MGPCEGPCGPPPGVSPGEIPGSPTTTIYGKHGEIVKAHASQKTGSILYLLYFCVFTNSSEYFMPLLQNESGLYEEPQISYIGSFRKRSKRCGNYPKAGVQGAGMPPAMRTTVEPTVTSVDSHTNHT